MDNLTLCTSWWEAWETQTRFCNVPAKDAWIESSHVEVPQNACLRTFSELACLLYILQKYKDYENKPTKNLGNAAYYSKPKRRATENHVWSNNFFSYKEHYWDNWQNENVFRWDNNINVNFLILLVLLYFIYLFIFWKWGSH